MGIARYVRWRLSPQGRAAYKSYAQGRAEVVRLAQVPAPARARVTGRTARRPQRGIRRAMSR